MEYTKQWSLYMENFFDPATPLQDARIKEWQKKKN